MSLRHLLAIALLAIALPASAATEVIELNYRSADEMLPVINDVLGADGRASAYGNQLIVNASPAKIGEIRMLLQQLDNAPKRLLITVEADDSNTTSNRGYQADGRISAGSSHVQIGTGAQHGSNQLRIINRSTDSRDAERQQIQATEGYPALIQIGQSVPLTNTAVSPYGHLEQHTQYRDVTRGFYVTATVHGDRVQLSISSQRDTLNTQQRNVIDTQSTETRVSGPLGQWISLSSSAQSSGADDRGVLRSYSTSGRQDMALRVMVQMLD